MLAFTGVATVGTGPSAQRTVDWLSAELRALPHDCDLQDICNSLSRRATVAMKPHGTRGVLTLVLAVSVVGKPFRVAVISNADWRERPPRARNHFNISIHWIRKPFQRAFGFRDCLPQDEQDRLMALARRADKSPNEIIEELRSINAVAARRSQGHVSEGCWVTSQVADGRVRRSASRNFSEQGGLIPLIHHGMDLSEWVKENFRAAPGKQISLVQTAGFIAGPVYATPLPPPEGQPRRFVLCGPPATGVLRSPSGHPCASIEISQLDCQVLARRNEEVTLPFARIQLKADEPMSEDFPRPLLPWPTLRVPLTVDGASVPRGWEQAVGYWVKGGMHHVDIPRTSRGIRNLAFLGDDDELILVVSGTELTWASSQDGPTATLQANISWRVRLDGTRG